MSDLLIKRDNALAILIYIPFAWLLTKLTDEELTNAWKRQGYTQET